MNDKSTNLVYALFTWFGRIGPVRFFITTFLLFLLASPLYVFDVPSSFQEPVMTIIAWCCLMQFIKRGHDFGAPAWMSLIAFCTIIIVIPAFFWGLMPGDNAHNKYGVDSR